MNLDQVLAVSSLNVFAHLEEKHYRILKILAKSGILNQKEIGDQASNNYPSDPLFRWEVKKRLEGSYKHIGLIPNEFVYSVNKNKKEKSYGLTIKGIMAVTAGVNLEKVHAVIEYRKLLNKYNKKRKITDWAFKFIKLEMALILYYNYARGLDLTKFKRIRSYMDRYKQYDHEIIQTFFVSTDFMNKKDRITYDSIQKNYLAHFFILDELTTPITWGQTREYYEPKEYEGSFRKFIDNWHQYIDMHKIGESHVRIDWKRDDLSPYYDEEFWMQETKEPKLEAYRILKNYKYV